MLNKSIEYKGNVPFEAYVSHITQQPVHIHNDDVEIVVLLKGTVKAVVGYRTMMLKEGDVFIFNDMEIHRVFASDDDNLVLTAHINLRYFEKFNEAAFKSVFLMAATYMNEMPYDEPLENLKDHLFMMVKAMYSGEAADEKMESMCLDLLNRLLDDFQYFYFSSSGGKHFVNRYENKSNQTQALRTRELMYYLWDNYDQKTTLQEYADETYINMYYLSHIIKDATGLNFQELLNYTRVESSEEELLLSDKKISKIALECGFSATRYYVKNFKNWFRVSPEEYRENNLKNLKIKTEEDILEKDDAIAAINEHSSRKYHFKSDQANFFTNVIEVNMNKKGKKRKGPFKQIIQWDYRLDYQGGDIQSDLRKIVQSFCLCAPIKSPGDFNYRLKEFLKESDNHSLIFNFEAGRQAREKADEIIEGLSRFCSAEDFQNIDVYVEYAENMPAQEKREYAESIRLAGESSDCIIKVRELPKDMIGRNTGNYFLDSVYVAPWIIRNCLESDNGMKILNTAFDEGGEYGRTISGKSGLVTENNIKKPAYYAYAFLSLLGNEIVDNSEGYIVTKSGDDIQILLYDYGMEIMNSLDQYTDWRKLNTLRHATKKDKEYKMELQNIRGNYSLTEISLGNESCIFSRMADLGMPDMLSVESEDNIRQFMTPQLEFGLLDGSSGMLSIDVKVPRYGAVILQLKKTAE